jgi:NADH dehydrogenase
MRTLLRDGGPIIEYPPRDEVKGLSAGLLVSEDTPTCATRFSDWIRERGDSLGRRYASELARHWR